MLLIRRSKPRVGPKEEPHSQDGDLPALTSLGKLPIQIGTCGMEVADDPVLVLLPTPSSVGIMTNMKAELLLRERIEITAGSSFAELVVWSVPSPVRGSSHGFKYRLALVVDGVCVLRYDNEAGKGDHKHIGGKEIPYIFTNAEKMLADFWADVRTWR